MLVVCGGIYGVILYNLFYICFIGVVLLIGLKMGKVVGFLSRFKCCRKCMVVKKLNRILIKYKCRKNWVGLVKVMELDMIVEMF